MSKNVNKKINGGAAGKAKAAGRMATVAVATIAMTGGSLLSPLTAVAQGANSANATGKPAAVLSPLTSAAAASAGAGTVSAAQKVANLQAAVDAARAKAAAAKADLDAAGRPSSAVFWAATRASFLSVRSFFAASNAA